MKTVDLGRNLQRSEAGANVLRSRALVRQKKLYAIHRQGRLPCYHLVGTGLNRHAVPTYHISRTADGVITDIPGAHVSYRPPKPAESFPGLWSVNLPPNPHTVFGGIGDNGEPSQWAVQSSFYLTGPESPELYNWIYLWGPMSPAVWYWDELRWIVTPVAPDGFSWIDDPPYIVPWPIWDTATLAILDGYLGSDDEVHYNLLATVVVEDLRRIRVPDQASTFSLLAVAALGLAGFSRCRFRSV